MTPLTPRLRSNVKVSRQQTGGETFYILKDPVTGSFFRLREPEQFIASQCDGKTPIEVLRQRTEKRFNTELPAAVLTGFLKTLDKAGLFEGSEQAAKARSDEGRVRGSLLYLRFKLLDPAGLFRFLRPLTALCFTPSFVALMSVSILAAVAAALVNWDLLLRDFVAQMDPSLIPLALVVTFFTISLHEFGHGLTCRHFGGEVREMGFLLIYFQPAFYCNVSDAWLFPDKSKRMWVGLAGPFVELFTWAIAVFLWRVAETDTLLNRIALIIIASSGIKTLFNFNPLLKLDGYYLLSDYLDVPNLRKKSFQYVGGLFRRVATLDYRDTGTLTRRERRIFLMYGLCGIVGSMLPLAYVLWGAMGYVSMGGPAALLGLAGAGLVAARGQRWFKRLFSRSGSIDEEEEKAAVVQREELEPDEADPEDREDDRDSRRSRESSRHRRRRQWRRWLKRLILLAILAGAGWAAFHVEAELRIVGPFTIIPAQSTEVRAEVDGLIEQVLVQEGATVRAGDLVARLSGRDLWNSLSKIDSEVREGQARLRLLEAGPSEQEITVARTVVEKADRQAKFARNQLERAKAQLAAGVLSQNSFERVREIEINADADLVEAKARLEAVLGSVRPEQIEAANAQIERLETEREYLKEQLRFTFVLTPVTGVVGTPARELMLMPRKLVKKGDSIFKIYHSKTVTAEIRVPEREIADVKVGQLVEMRARAHPSQIFQGTVLFISTNAQGGAASGSALLGGVVPTGRSSDVTVMTRIENQSDILKPEMTGQAKIHVENRRIVDLIARRLARTFNVELWSLW